MVSRLYYSLFKKVFITRIGFIHSDSVIVFITNCITPPQSLQCVQRSVFGSGSGSPGVTRSINFLVSKTSKYQCWPLRGRRVLSVQLTCRWGHWCRNEDMNPDKTISPQSSLAAVGSESYSVVNVHIYSVHLHNFTSWKGHFVHDHSITLLNVADPFAFRCTFLTISQFCFLCCVINII